MVLNCSFQTVEGQGLQFLELVSFEPVFEVVLNSEINGGGCFALSLIVSKGTQFLLCLCFRSGTESLCDWFSVGTGTKTNFYNPPIIGCFIQATIAVGSGLFLHVFLLKDWSQDVKKMGPILGPI